MTKTNNSSSPMIEDIFQQLNRHGVSPDDLSFRFSCQQCGLRCCWGSSLETVAFLPYSYAYIIKTIPKRVLQYFFDSGLLKWEYHARFIPMIRINFVVCPFLTFHFDQKTKHRYNDLLTQKKDSLDPTVQLFLLFVLNDLS